MMIRWTNGGQNHEGGQTAANIRDTTGQTMVGDGENEHSKGSKGSSPRHSATIHFTCQYGLQLSHSLQTKINSKIIKRNK